MTRSEAVLEGPGELIRSWTLVADPAPTACFRGGFQSTRQAWRLRLPAGESTTVTIPARLVAARLEGMATGLRIQVTDPAGSPEVTAPLKIAGTEGARIEIELSRRKVKSQQRFTLAGRTIPALPNRWLQVRADPRMWNGKGRPPRTQVILTVRTDEQGRFRSRPVSLRASASWVLTSQLRSPAPYDGAASCNGTVTVSDGWYRPTWTDLKDSRFVSTKVKGWKMGVTKRYRRDGSVRSTKKNRLTLNFGLAPQFRPGIPDFRDWPRVPSLSPNTGCNRMGGEISVEKGRIKFKGGVSSTLMLCRPNNDEWITRLLDKGMKAAMKDRLLVLKRGKTTIVLKRRP